VSTLYTLYTVNRGMTIFESWGFQITTIGTIVIILLARAYSKKLDTERDIAVKKMDTEMKEMDVEMEKMRTYRDIEVKKIDAEMMKMETDRDIAVNMMGMENTKFPSRLALGSVPGMLGLGSFTPHLPRSRVPAMLTAAAPAAPFDIAGIFRPQKDPEMVPQLLGSFSRRKSN